MGHDDDSKLLGFVVLWALARNSRLVDIPSVRYGGDSQLGSNAHCATYGASQAGVAIRWKDHVGNASTVVSVPGDGSHLRSHCRFCRMAHCNTDAVPKLLQPLNSITVVTIDITRMKSL